jgi:hypothetical protein
MPNGFVELSLFHQLSKANFWRLAPNGYRVFQEFCASIIVSYNLDGLALNFCGPQHRILTPHETVPYWYGATEIAHWLRDAIAIPDLRRAQALNLTFFEPEDDSRVDIDYEALLGEPQFVSIVGYSFARNDDQLDDQSSFERLTRALLLNPKPIFIFSPDPRDREECLTETIKNKNVFAVPVHWQLFARAILDVKGDLAQVAHRYHWLCDNQ